MELSHEFEVTAPIDRAWEVLTDLEQIAPCMPGAQLTEVDGEEYRGTVKVKVGPITAQYKGVAHIVERDDEAHTALLSASGRDTKGQGNASASIAATLTPSAKGTHVSLVTDLTVTGKVAQFGRSLLGDVSNTILAQFVENLEATVLSADASAERSPQASAADEAAGTEGPRRIDSPEAEPVDLIATAGTPVAKRLTPALVAGSLLALAVVLLRRRRRRRRAS